MNNRIRTIRQSLKITQSKFGEHIGLKQSSINDIEHGKCNITERVIISICSRFNVNENWLRTGKGEMFNISDKKYQEFFEIYEQFPEPLQDFLKRTAQDLLDTQKNMKEG